MHCTLLIDPSLGNFVGGKTVSVDLLKDADGTKAVQHFLIAFEIGSLQSDFIVRDWTELAY